MDLDFSFLRKTVAPTAGFEAASSTVPVTVRSPIFCAWATGAVSTALTATGITPASNANVHAAGRPAPRSLTLPPRLRRTLLPLPRYLLLCAPAPAAQRPPLHTP